MTIDPLEGPAFEPQYDLAAIMARNAAWLNELEQARAGDAAPPETSSLGIFGARAGVLVLERSGRRAYASSARLHLGGGGQLLDDRGRSVLGYAVSEGDRATPRPVRVPNATNGLPFARYEIDERGTIVGEPAHSATALVPVPVPLARLCVAVFPAPQELVEDGDVLVATRSAGKPSFAPADDANIGGLERQPTIAQTTSLQAQAREAWIASAQAELQVALSSSRDALVRVALDVVK